MSDGPEIPELPEGTLLTLRAGEAMDFHGLDSDYRDVKLVRVFPAVTLRRHGHVWVAVAAHEHPTCTWDATEPHRPCVELVVRADVLRRHAG